MPNRFLDLSYVAKITRVNGVKRTVGVKRGFEVNPLGLEVPPLRLNKLQKAWAD